MKRLIFIFILLTTAYSQPLQKDMQIFADRRAAFMEKIGPNCIAIFPSKPIYLRNLDIEYPYRQESNFYSLSGFEELYVRPDVFEKMPERGYSETESQNTISR